MKLIKKNSIFIFLVFVLCSFLFVGCLSVFNKENSPYYGKSNQDQTGQADSNYQFEDITVPGELKIDTKSTFIVKPYGVSSGVLSLKGRIETQSLFDFFENNMAKKNWRAIASFKSQRSMMMYNKDNRWCMIRISEELTTTEVEIWVSNSSASFGNSSNIKGKEAKTKGEQNNQKEQNGQKDSIQEDVLR